MNHSGPVFVSSTSALSTALVTLFSPSVMTLGLSFKHHHLCHLKFGSCVFMFFRAQALILFCICSISFNCCQPSCIIVNIMSLYLRLDFLEAVIPFGCGAHSSIRKTSFHLFRFWSGEQVLSVLL